MDLLVIFQIATGIFAGLFTISEALSAVDSIKSNAVYQLINMFLKKLAGK